MTVAARLPIIACVAAAAVVAGSALVTLLMTAAIERQNPPQGQFVAVAGGRLHVLQLGPAEAPAIVLLHGASGNLNDMRLALGERLAARYRVILVDRPGHGWSDRPGGASAASPARQAALIHDALRRIGVGRAVVLGHSWSGALATAYALAYPGDVAGLVLLSPVTHPWPGAVSLLDRVVAARWIGPLLTRTVLPLAGYWLIAPGIRSVFAPQTPPRDYGRRIGVELLLRPAELRANAQDIVGLKPFVAAQAPRYGAITVPTAIIAGDADTIVSTGIHARAIAAMLPRATLTILPGIGHMPHHAATGPVIEAIDRVMAQAR